MNDKVPEKKARQGRSGFPVLVVLLAGLVLAGLVWVAAEYYGIFIEEERPVEVGPTPDELPVETEGAQPE